MVLPKQRLLELSIPRFNSFGTVCRMFRVSLHEERRCIFHAVLHEVGARKSGQAMLDY